MIFKLQLVLLRDLRKKRKSGGNYFLRLVCYCTLLSGKTDAGQQDCKNTPPLLSLVSSRFIFVFARFQFSGPDYLRAWNRLNCLQMSFQKQLIFVSYLKTLSVVSVGPARI